MNTTDNLLAIVEKRIRQTGGMLGGIGELFQGTKGFILGIVALTGTITTLLIVQPDPPSPPVPVPLPVPVPDPIPNPDNYKLLNVKGTWYNPENQPISISQNGSDITFDMQGNYDGTPCQFIGQGTLVNKSVEFNLELKAYGALWANIPAKLTFMDEKNAIARYTFMDIPVAVDLHR